MTKSGAELRGAIRPSTARVIRHRLIVSSCEAQATIGRQMRSRANHHLRSKSARFFPTLTFTVICAACSLNREPAIK